RNPKTQIPNPNKIPNLKSQTGRVMLLSLELGICLELGILGFGISLELGSWCLELSLGFSLHCFCRCALGVCFRIMKSIAVLTFALICLGLSGCASYQGGGADEYNSGYGSLGNPASPTFRPGMNPQDPRDPTASSRPPVT